MKVSTKLTSVKIINSLYQMFRFNTVNTPMTLQKFVNRTMYLYTADQEFKQSIDESTCLTVSGSGF